MTHSFIVLTSDKESLYCDLTSYLGLNIDLVSHPTSSGPYENDVPSLNLFVFHLILRSSTPHRLLPVYPYISMCRTRRLVHDLTCSVLPFDPEWSLKVQVQGSAWSTTARSILDPDLYFSTLRWWKRCTDQDPKNRAKQNEM